MAAGEAQGNSGSRWQPLGWLWLLALLVTPASAEQLNLGLMPSSTELRDRMLAVISQFHLQYPEHRINVVLSDAELVKGATDSAGLNRVLGNVDLFIWYGGEPTFKLARLGELDDLSAIWQQQQLQPLFPAALGPAISLDGQIYALPLSFYTWGLLYRPQLLLDHGVRPPATFEQLLDVCHQLSARGLVPVLLGSRHPWTLAGWLVRLPQPEVAGARLSPPVAGRPDPLYRQPSQGGVRLLAAAARCPLLQRPARMVAVG